MKVIMSNPPYSTDTIDPEVMLENLMRIDHEIWSGDGKGGPGSGDHGHAGRPGEVGGSGSGTHFDHEQFGKLKALIEKTPMHDAIWHGEDHWQHEAMTGLRLADADPRVDRGLVLMFAMIHDTHRENEYSDPDHGQRAADFAKGINDSILHLSPEHLSTLVEACVNHDRGTTTKDPTIGAMWDSDRLQLQRVGKTPLPKYLSTDTGPKIIAETTQALKTDYTWDGVYQAYKDGLKSTKGGPGSGDHGHAGRPGEVGGSANESAASASAAAHEAFNSSSGPRGIPRWNWRWQIEVQSLQAEKAAQEAWFSKLTGAEKRAVKGYNIMRYDTINARLRAGKPMTPGDVSRQAALSKSVLPNMEVLRSCAFDPKLGVGAVFQDNGFVSTSAALKGLWSEEVGMRISIPSGAHGAFMAGVADDFPDFHEVLLPAGSKFKVTAVSEEPARIEGNGEIIQRHAAVYSLDLMPQ